MRIRIPPALPLPVLLSHFVLLWPAAGAAEPSQPGPPPAVDGQPSKGDASPPDLHVLGYLETVELTREKLTLTAKLDTGATTSSVHALDIAPFERDGTQWIRFFLIDTKSGQKVKLEREIVRYLRIKEHFGESQRRPVVHLTVRIADITAKREFNLVDRSNFLYPVLLGRNFLSGLVLVDSSRKMTGGKPASANAPVPPESEEEEEDSGSEEPKRELPPPPAGAGGEAKSPPTRAP